MAGRHWMNYFFLSVVVTVTFLHHLTKAQETEGEETADEVELVVEVFEEGDCAQDKKTKDGDKLTVHYKGHFLSNNDVFDSSFERKEPLQFTLGDGAVIKGWDKGLVGMCVGERRILTIPPKLAYGEKGLPPAIPRNSILKFDVLLVDIE